MTAPPLLIGRYALCDELARGGMATVHLGRLLGPAGFARTVAIKRLHPHLASDPAFVAMLLDEARLAARVQHPNVAATLDVVAKDGELFVVMEYLHGESLSRLFRIARERVVPPAIASAILINALSGLHAAHEARGDGGEPLKLIHRDVSPQNIMVRSDGSAAVVDFGVAKAAGRFHSTAEGQIKGKLPYMAPEQVRGQTLTRGVDIYAAAAVLWELLTGERLVAGSNEGEVLEKLLFSTFPPPSTKVPGIPPALDAVVMRGLDRNRDKRCATAREMALALEEAMPPATASRVSLWLETMVGDSLNQRQTRLAAIESATYAPPVRIATVLAEISPAPEGGVEAPRPESPRASPAKEVTTRASGAVLAVEGEPGAAAPARGSDPVFEVRMPPAVAAGPAPRLADASRWGSRRIAVGTGLLALAAGALWLGRTRSTVAAAPDDPASARVGATPPPPPGSAEPPPQAAAADSALPSPSSVSPAVAAEAPLRQAPPASTAAPASSPAGRRAASPPRSNPPRTAPDCAVPFVVDATGKKTYRRECL
jgi:serine/threonine-protein kinase